MNYRLFIDFRADPETLNRSIDSVFDGMPNITVIDNSEHGLPNELSQQCLKRNIEIVRNVLALTPVQTMNQATLYADELDVAILMQNGAEAMPGAAREFIGEIQEQVEADAKYNTGAMWGCVYMRECILAFNTKVLRRLGEFDTEFWYSTIMAGTEYRFRIRNAGFRDICSNTHFTCDWPKRGLMLPQELRAAESSRLHHYYNSKWGGLSYRLPFLGKARQEWLDSIRRGHIFDELSKRPSDRTGLLDHENMDTMIAQTETISRYINASRADNILEVGTGKGWFAYLLANLYSRFSLYTFDNASNDDLPQLIAQVRPDLLITPCKTELLPSILSQLPEAHFNLTWINPKDSSTIVYQDICLAMEAKIPYILVNETKGGFCKQACMDAIEEHSEYREDPCEYSDRDHIGITILTCD